MKAGIIAMLSMIFVLSIPYATDYQQYLSIEEQGHQSPYFHNLPYLFKAYTNHDTLSELRAKMNFLYNAELRMNTQGINYHVD